PRSLSSLHGLPRPKRRGCRGGTGPARIPRSHGSRGPLDGVARWSPVATRHATICDALARTSDGNLHLHRFGGAQGQAGAQFALTEVRATEARHSFSRYSALPFVVSRLSLREPVSKSATPRCWVMRSSQTAIMPGRKRRRTWNSGVFT